jgi:hypothetical protein
MNGYLDRLIAHARVPPARIQPLVRPLFAPARSSFAVTPLYEEAADLSAAPRLSAPIAQSTLTRDVPAPRTADKSAIDQRAFDPSSFEWHPGSDRRHGSSPSDDDGRTGLTFKPLMPPREERLEGSAEMSSARAPDSATRIAPDQPTGSRLQDASRGATIQPLMPASQARPRLTAVPPPPAPPQMDEVQIHIGRIEISAVPPASPRPAARAPHRGVNLDEYLRKGKGSAR